MNSNATLNYRDPAIVRKAGLDALKKELGVVGTVCFMRLFEPGYGNYTEEREKLLEHITLEDAIKGIRELEKQKA